MTAKIIQTNYLLITFACIINCSPVLAQDAGTERDLSGLNIEYIKQKIFVEKSLEFLSDRKEINGEPRILIEDKELRKRYDAFVSKGKPKHFEAYSERAHEIALAKDKWFNIQIRTEKEGAMIRYQSVYNSSGEPSICHELTNNCTLRLPYGEAFIWTERNGKETSDRRKYLIESDDIITIPEN